MPSLLNGIPDDKQTHCRTGEEFEYEKLHFRGLKLGQVLICIV